MPLLFNLLVLTAAKPFAVAVRRGLTRACVPAFSLLATVLYGGTTDWPIAVMQSGTRESCKVRVATFNVALNRKSAGDLEKELRGGNSIQARMIAEVIQRVRPDVILLNEFDFSESPKAARLFQDEYLAVPWNGHPPIVYPYSFCGPVNTGRPSGLDLNRNGATGDPEDAHGFGAFPGQYGMLVLSRYPFRTESIRTFRRFPWHKMPDALRPVDPASGESWFADAAWNELYLSSKSHWDLPLQINGTTVHLLCSHPVPPVFDGPEDRNGCRNHDEIRLWADYVGGRGGYLVDDNGKAGGLGSDSLFVIAGDLNADPHDGDNRDHAIRQLLDHPNIDAKINPASKGASEAARRDGLANDSHRGDASLDTADFGDEFSGNLRVDYCLPARGLRPLDAGVFWPASDEEGDELNAASDHHLVWIDLVVESR